jgi:hypothetical protein
MRPYYLENKSKRTEGVVRVVEHLLGQQEALSSSSSTANNNNQKNTIK